MLTFARAVAWFGVVVVFWSLNVRWGTDADVGAGPPGHWERQVVGAGMLAIIAAMSLSASGRKGKPPSWRARGVAFTSAVLILVIAMLLRSNAMGGITGADLIEGPGWTWLLSGGGFVLGATTMTLAIGPPGSSSAKSAGKAAGTKPAGKAAASKPTGKKPAGRAKKRRRK
jgi:hypothetical protein